MILPPRPLSLRATAVTKRPRPLRPTTETPLLILTRATSGETDRPPRAATPTRRGTQRRGTPAPRLVGHSVKRLRVASVQFQHAPGDKRHNLAVMQGFVEQAAQQRVEMLLFPECCICGYWHLRKLTRQQLQELAEPVPHGPSVRRLLNWSTAYEMTICAGRSNGTARGGSSTRRSRPWPTAAGRVTANCTRS